MRKKEAWTRKTWIARIAVILLIFAISSAVCGCTKPIKSEKAYPAKLNAVIIRCEKSSGEWCLYVTMTLPSPCYRVKYEGLKIRGDTVSVYFKCEKIRDACAQVLTTYSKNIRLGALKGDYSIRIYVNGVLKSSFRVELS